MCLRSQSNQTQYISLRELVSLFQIRVVRVRSLSDQSVGGLMWCGVAERSLRCFFCSCLSCRWLFSGRRSAASLAGFVWNKVLKQFPTQCVKHFAEINKSILKYSPLHAHAHIHTHTEGLSVSVMCRLLWCEMGCQTLSQSAFYCVFFFFVLHILTNYLKSFSPLGNMDLSGLTNSSTSTPVGGSVAQWQGSTEQTEAHTLCLVIIQRSQPATGAQKCVHSTKSL